LGHAKTIIGPGRAALLGVALGATLALGGCGGVEFQGKIFEAVGLSGDIKQPDVRMAERPPLLVPPDLNTLPQPGGGVAVATAREDWPKNPEEQRKAIIKAEKDAQAKEQSAREPLHPYIGKPTLFNKLLGKKKEAEPLDDVPEPDPSDKPKEGEDVAEAKHKPLTPHVPQDIKPTEDLFNPPPPNSYKNPSALY
jgi:hypothetical protein